MTGIAKSLLFIAGLAVITEVAIALFQLSPAAFATPREVLGTAPDFFDLDKNAFDLLYTVARTLAAFLISMPLGLFIGWLATKVPLFGAQTRGFVDFLRSIPGTALVPVFFVVFGIGEIGRVSAAVYGGSLTVAIATIVGLRSISPERRFVVLQTYGTRGGSFLRFELPEILPTILVGMRTCISLCLVLVIVAEMFMGSATGLGSVVNDTRYSGDVPRLYTAILFAGLLGYTLNSFVSLIEYSLQRAFPRFQ